jgi:TonB family protein
MPAALSRTQGNPMMFFRSKPRAIVPLLAFSLAVATPPLLAQTSPNSPANSGPVADFSTCYQPVWPRAALRAEQSGAVTLKFLIDRDGTVVDSRIVRTSLFPMLDSAARFGAMQCKFKSGTKDGQARQAWMQMQYVWTLDPLAKESPKIRLEAEEGAQGGETSSQYMLAMLLAHGEGEKSFLPKAQSLFALAAAKNHVPSMLELARLLRDGPDGAAKRAEIVDLYTKAASMGDVSAKYLLAMTLIEAPASERERDDAETLLRSAVSEYHMAAVAPLGNLLLANPRKAGDQAEGIELLRLAVARNDPYAHIVLGRAYENGTGVAQDHAAAAALYEKAAAGGYAEARYALDRLYSEGLASRPK